MKLRYILKYIKDYIRLGFNSDGDPKFSKIILKKIKKGIYLDIGCYHPIKGSNTALLYKNGWSGINIDISEETIEMFKIFRPNDTNLFLGISIKNGYQKAYFEKSISTLSSLDETYLNKQGRKNLIIKKVKVLTLKSLRKKHNIKKLDFLKIDCENIDMSIIMKSSLKDLDSNYLCFEILPPTIYGWENYKYPPISNKKYYRNYFLKSAVYEKLRKKFIFIDNVQATFFLKKK
ncbi:MAG: hypothetical protein CL471_05910 [Acidobacteria bacterium]|jgi:hypothetical protein|nr:hypothetical protein [Acidobacteriota bacterium]|tara:strand:+ start:1919 stop:2617 length:699 start_codon:yes stop_codon:yes gene_type:complete